VTRVTKAGIANVSRISLRVRRETGKE
jgi:hypothetical protein